MSMIGDTEMKECELVMAQLGIIGENPVATIIVVGVGCDADVARHIEQEINPYWERGKNYKLKFSYLGIISWKGDMTTILLHTNKEGRIK
jgi:hypothetical protein